MLESAFIIVIADIAIFVIPIALSDWRNARSASLLTLLFSLACAVEITFAAGEHRDLMVICGAGAAAILAAISRVLGVLSISVARSVSPALDPASVHRL
ncbi:hypothetical protein [Breoghania sp.]|uniref:hypothetical protein n=1 Tax=Breoghania sp. TaxID=2065378 RepID=UPI0029C9EF15|nr:hypothetical protein [Breoghania sp.]